MSTQSRRLKTTEGSYLQTVYNDPGGAGAAKAGQKAAAGYLTRIGRDQKGDTQLRFAMAIAGLSAVVASLFTVQDISNTSPKSVDPIPVSATKGKYGCMVEVDSDAGLGSAWDIAKKVAPKGKLEGVFNDLAQQSRSVDGLENGDQLLIPTDACSNNVVKPLSDLDLDGTSE